ncbi:hypothetical protein [Helicobacter suis]|uniref:hypothetical protein n=1 Tax=Helicobacter suis TaxID=104628 RepID=UPI0013D11EE5|nr:hypothetical protein [Helicobacter suis]
MRLFLLALLAFPLCAKPLMIASDLSNQEGFLDLLQEVFKQDNSQKINWIKPPKHICMAQGYILSKSALQGGKIKAEKALFQEELLLLGPSSQKTRFQSKKPIEVLKILKNMSHLKMMLHSYKPYQSSDLILISQRLYLQKKNTLPPLLYKPLHMRYFWANPCHSQEGKMFLKWLESPRAQESIQGFRIDYHTIFTPLKGL